MAKKKNSRAVIENVIASTLEDFENKGFPKDPSLDEEQELSGPERFVKGQKSKDEVVIDELFSNIAGKEGYFVKLKKEVRPNEWMVMKIIENDWRKWADIEAAVYDMVRDHTRRWPQKWGSGFYRVEIACKGGMRGQKYPVHDVHVNADEELVNPAPGMQQPIDATASVAGKLEELSTLVNVLGDIMPKPQDPSVVQSQIASAFEKGLSIKASEGSNNNQVMIALITGMMGMMTSMMNNRGSNEPRVVNPNEQLSGMLDTLKTFGVLGGSNPQQKTAIDFMKELKEMGLDLFKKDDPMEQVKKLKEIAGVAAQFMGMGGDGEKPSIMERVIDLAVPMLPQVISDVKEATKNAVEVQRIAGANIEKATQVNAGGRKLVSVNVPQPENVNPGEKSTYQAMREAEEREKVMNPQPANNAAVENPQVKMFFDSLFTAIQTNNRMFYPVIYTSLMQDANGQALMQGIINGTHNAMHLVETLAQYGDDRFKNVEFINKYMVSYANGYLLWVKNMMAPQQETAQPSMNGAGPYEVECQQCSAVYEFATKQEFDNEQEKICKGELQDGSECPGVLKPVAKIRAA